MDNPNDLLNLKKNYDIKCKLHDLQGLCAPTPHPDGVVGITMSIIHNTLQTKPERKHLKRFIEKKFSKKIKDFDVNTPGCGTHRKFFIDLLINTTLFKKTRVLGFTERQTKAKHKLKVLH